MRSFSVFTLLVQFRVLEASKEVILEVILFISIPFRQASVSSLAWAFWRTAMRRWDRLLDSYVEEYRARGVSAQSVAYTEARLNRWGRYRARNYDPSAGRFLSEDRLRFQGGANFYQYVQNSPTSWIDPSGDNLCFSVTSTRLEAALKLIQELKKRTRARIILA